MLGAIIPAAISAIGSLIGGSMSQNSAENQAAANIANQERFAKNAIQWKVADATKAGVHPLFALGAQTNSFANVTGDTGAMGDAVAKAGQDVSRAATALFSREERALQLKGAQLEVENKGLQNDVLRAELASKVARLTSPGTPPPFPTITTPGVGSPNVKVNEDTRQRLNLFGHELKIANIPDANTIEQRYGEIADMLYGGVAIPADAMVNAWPVISRFIDWSGLGNPVNEESWRSTVNKFGRYYNYLGRR